MAMKNWKKLISGVVAMMTVAAAVSAAPAKLPVEVLDVADATGIGTVSGTQANSAIKAADNGGTWYFTNGTPSGTVGELYETEDGVRISHVASSRNRELSAGYTTDSVNTYADTKVQFSYMVSEVREKNSQLIQLSSGTIAAGQPSFAGVADCAGMAGGLFQYHNNSAIVQLSAEGIKYLDPVSGELKKVDVELNADTVYSFRFENVAGEGTYDLYIDEDKIGVNSTPVAEDIALFNPTGEALNTVRVWLESANIGDNAETEEDELQLNKFYAVLSDVRFMQSVSDKPFMNKIKSEKFDTLPTDGWTPYVGGSNPARTGSVTAAGTLKLAYRSDYGRNGAVYMINKDADIKALDEYEISYKFTPTLTAGKYEVALLLYADESSSTPVVDITNKPSGTGVYTNSIHLAIKQDSEGKDEFVYGCSDETGHYFKSLADVVKYESEKTYFMKVKVNNNNKTYTMWLSDKDITTATTPIIENAGFFIPEENASNVYQARYQIHRLTGEATVGQVTVDDLLVSSKASPYVVISEGFKSRPVDGWSYREDFGTVTADGSLTVKYSQNTGKFRNAYAKYTNQTIATLDKYNMEFDFIPDYVSADYAMSIDLVAEGTEVDADLTTDGIAPAKNGIQIAMIDDQFLYAATDADGNSYKEIPGVTYNKGTKYYARIAVNNVEKTYDLYLSNTELTDDTQPVLKGVSFFSPVDGAANPSNIQFYVKRNTANNTLGAITVDNLIVKKVVEIPTGFAIMNDDQQYMTSLGTSAYIDLINVPTDKEVIVAYYDADNKLVDVAVATADALRAKKTDATAVSALVMTWDDFNNIVPVDAAIELK